MTGPDPTAADPATSAPPAADPGGVPAGGSEAAVSEAELAAMASAAELARTVLGRTSPNPPVAAIILDARGHRVGSGVTSPPGGPHAEVAALAEAGTAARGGTAVVTLEPCNHVGRTGPCSEALIAAGIRRVVYAVPDTNPTAAGGGERLSAAGVEVFGGVAETEVATGALRYWLHGLDNGRPFVTWKFAATLDGRSAAADGTSRWITNPLARADVHALRSEVDAIVVGSGTVLADDPQLTARPHAASSTSRSESDAAGADAPAEHQPLRVVLDRRHRVGPQARVFDDSAETVSLDTAVPRFALKALFDRGVRHILLEGGPTLAGAFLEAGLIDEVVAYLAPTLLGAGPAALSDAGITTMAGAVTLTGVVVTQLGDNVKIVGRPRRFDGQEG
ncbi:bifunctional diaminohydroxyphosphoribosylaminopyrimidine deaminase/5-amino-6-(5-phosphoribosylamino)uracil reductase RibD [Jatrophihabitans telluris]|uniref:Riboflavin biosynthesis protein RibD n=1 Tax=Jatrophihabitans telluris TaxID=2038343 RepID=A0ABY4R2B6_9ACTN|nr:bifunctional diaminohydroxyphosphoribosylaminopyrimidine deaminase/5-amino-6-(5-phosphoribosylamino)uracil reductase RibD [Jatrophihabitans telluris]UQX90071.1 bifunctional diaminohydroxyphosphoribosylaminopyrimidine deaminase/5-amino-6-(5-phosphoribosylamino)uracil reductase RibD [Jatrophihabitans telluris]